MVTAIRPQQLDAALRIVLRADLGSFDRATWPALLDAATRVVLGAGDGELRSSLFVAERETRRSNALSTNGITWTAVDPAETLGTPVFAQTYAAQTYETTTVPRRLRRRLGRGSYVLLACGAVLALTGLNLLFGPAADLMHGASLSIPPELLGQLALLAGLAASAWAATQWVLLRSYTDSNVTPPGAINWGLPLACMLAVLALGLSIAGAARPLAGATTAPVTARQVAVPPPAAFQAPSGAPNTALSVTASPAGNASLLRGSAALVRDITTRVTTMARQADSSPPSIARSNGASGQTPGSPAIADEPAAGSAFSRVSDGAAGDLAPARAPQVSVPGPDHIRLAPPPTPRSTPPPTVRPTQPLPRTGPAAGFAPGLPPAVTPPPVPTFPTGPAALPTSVPTASPAVRH